MLCAVVRNTSESAVPVVMEHSCMPKYEVVINGCNYLMLFEGEQKLMGFYVTRYVEESDPEQAELKALELVRGIDHLSKMVLNGPKDPPILRLDEMYEVESFNGLETLEPGICFYVEGDEDSDEIYAVKPVLVKDELHNRGDDSK